MLSSKTIRVYSFLYCIVGALNCVPFEWNYRNSVVKLYPSRRWGKWLGYLNCILDEIATLITCIGLCQFIFANYEKVARIIPGLTYIGTILFISALKYSSYIFQRELCNAANKVFQTADVIARLYNLEKDGPAKPDILLEVSSLGLMLITPTIPVAAFLYQLNDPMNLYLFYIGPSPIGQFVYSLFSLVLLYNKIWILNFMTLTMFAPAVILRYWLQRIREDAKMMKQLSLDCLYTTYVTAQLYFYSYRDAFCPFILPLYLFGCSFLCIIGSSMLILFSDQLRAPIIFIIADILFVIVFGFMYGFQMQIDLVVFSQHALHYMGRHSESGTEYLTRKHAAQVPIASHYSSMFKTSPLIILQIFAMITENIGSLVIGFTEF